MPHGDAQAQGLGAVTSQEADDSTDDGADVLILPLCKNNGFRALIVGIVSLASGLYFATDIAALHARGDA